MTVIDGTEGKKTLTVDQVHDNTSQEVIYINPDKLKLILIDHLGRVKSRDAWQMPFSLCITIGLVFASADFKAAFGFHAEFWQAVFFLLIIGCAVWFIVSLIRIRNGRTLDDVIAVIKNKNTGPNP